MRTLESDSFPSGRHDPGSSSFSGVGRVGGGGRPGLSAELVPGKRAVRSGHPEVRALRGVAVGRALLSRELPITAELYPWNEQARGPGEVAGDGG